MARNETGGAKEVAAPKSRGRPLASFLLYVIFTISAISYFLKQYI